MPACVFVIRTGCTGYSSDWYDTEKLSAEGEALKALCSLARERLGYDLFEAAMRPGDTVVVKPNLVRDWHPDGCGLESVITHPAVVHAVVDEVHRALKGEGRIVIADAPMADTDFRHLVEQTGLQRIADHYWKRFRFEIEIQDLRQYQYHFEVRPGGYANEVRSSLAGDSEGYQLVDLGAQSAFSDLKGRHLLEGTDVARRRETRLSHGPDVNRYLISRTVLNADALVSVPKLKVHSKVGVTLNCKNMVGINGDKNLLPHFRWGSMVEGGDQFPPGSQTVSSRSRMRLGRMVADHLLARQSSWAKWALSSIEVTSGAIARLLRLRPVDPINGDWPGNDTCWRLPADLIRVALFAGRDGLIHGEPQRRFLSVVDGIVGGEGYGPLRPTPKACGVLLAGFHPVAVDLVAARLMGFNPRKIRYLQELAAGAAARLTPGLGPIGLEQIEIISNHLPWQSLFRSTDPALAFDPPPRWKGHVEITS